MLAVIRDIEVSNHFIRYVANLAKDLDSGLHLFYVENPANYPMGTPEMTGVAVANLQESLQAKVEEAKRKIKLQVEELGPRLSDDLVTQVSTRVGNGTMLIQEMVENREADMVALEYKHISSFWKKDSYLREMMRNISCPVWVIPELTEYSGLKNILYATDYHEEDIPTLKSLISLTRSFSPEIDALHITERVDFDERVKKEGFQQMLETKTGYAQISLKVLTEGNGHDMFDLLKGYASRIKADLIVVLKENKNFLERVFNPGTSEKVIRKVDIPVLVFHESESA